MTRRWVENRLVVVRPPRKAPDAQIERVPLARGDGPEAGRGRPLLRPGVATRGDRRYVGVAFVRQGHRQRLSARRAAGSGVSPLGPVRPSAVATHHLGQLRRSWVAVPETSSRSRLLPHQLRLVALRVSGQLEQPRRPRARHVVRRSPLTPTAAHLASVPGAAAETRCRKGRGRRKRIAVFPPTNQVSHPVGNLGRGFNHGAGSAQPDPGRTR